MVENKINVARIDSILSNYLEQKIGELRAHYLLTIDASGVFRPDLDYKSIKIETFKRFEERITLLWKKNSSIIFDSLPINATQVRIEHECYRVFCKVIYPEYKEFVEKNLKKLEK